MATRTTDEIDEISGWLFRRFAPRQRTVALLGLRGAGKSTIGRLLAARTGLPFVELDALIEEAAGMSLAELFELEGTDTYRRLQRQVLDEVLRRPQAAVVATGGSIVTDEACYRRLKESCLTVWLKAAPEEHWDRVLAQGDHRPMGQNPHALAELRSLFAARAPLYAEAEVVVETSGREPAAVADSLAQKIARHGTASPAI